MKNSLRRLISATALLIVFFGLLFYPLVKVEHVKVTINEFFELNRFSLLPDGQRIFLYDRKKIILLLKTYNLVMNVVINYMYMDLIFRVL